MTDMQTHVKKALEFLLQEYDHFKNFNKRITKSPKIYFYDVGLVCSLLGIESSEILKLHPLYGNIFESFIISDLCKQYFNIGKRPPVYFWRDLNGILEVDCIIEEGLSLFPIEIKSGKTIASDYFKSLTKWNVMADNDADKSYVIYGGELKQERTAGHLLGWKESSSLVERIRSLG